ncbi:MAG: DUF4974 domain-containing protein [Odoribacter splanchnicus]
MDWRKSFPVESVVWGYLHYDREKFGDLKFYIKTRRYEDIGTILNLLKLTENVTYSIEGNEVTLYRTGKINNKE